MFFVTYDALKHFSPIIEAADIRQANKRIAEFESTMQWQKESGEIIPVCRLSIERVIPDRLALMDYIEWDRDYAATGLDERRIKAGGTNRTPANPTMYDSSKAREKQTVRIER